jgi:transcriptional regulator GlxA family with amidase domain
VTKGSSQGHRVAVVVDDGSNPFELGVATELFGLRRPELDRPWYDLVLCAARPQVRMHAGMFTLTGVQDLQTVLGADTVIVPNRPDPEIAPDPAVVAAVAAAGSRGARLVSFCTGAFTLAAAGVLDGRPATTHWRWAALFAQRYPEVRVQPDVLFIDDGDVLTAAGSAAALDLGLHLIRRDHGPRSPTRSAVDSSSPPTATAGSGSSSTVPCPRSATARSVRCWTGHVAGWTSRSGCVTWPRSWPSVRPRCTVASPPSSGARRWRG